MTCRSSHVGSSHSSMIFRVCKTLTSPDLQCQAGQAALQLGRDPWEKGHMVDICSSLSKVFSFSPLTVKALEASWHLQMGFSDADRCIHMSLPAKSQHHLEQFIVRPFSKGQTFDMLVYVGWSSYTRWCPQQTHNPCLLSCNGQRHSVGLYNDCRPAGDKHTPKTTGRT